MNRFAKACLGIVAMCISLAATVTSLTLWDKGCRILGLTAAVQNSHCVIFLLMLGGSLFLMLILALSLGLMFLHFAGVRR